MLVFLKVTSTPSIGGLSHFRLQLTNTHLQARPTLGLLKPFVQSDTWYHLWVSQRHLKGTKSEMEIFSFPSTPWSSFCSLPQWMTSPFMQAWKLGVIFDASFLLPPTSNSGPSLVSNSQIHSLHFFTHRLSSLFSCSNFLTGLLPIHLSAARLILPKCKSYPVTLPLNRLQILPLKKGPSTSPLLRGLLLPPCLSLAQETFSLPSEFHCWSYVWLFHLLMIDWFYCNLPKGKSLIITSVFLGGILFSSYI